MALSGGAARRGVAAVFLGIAGYYALWGGEYSACDLRRMEQAMEVAAASLQVARTEIDSLRAHADRLENDPFTIERVARERFGMIREGEVLYRFVEVDSGGPHPAP